MSEIRIRDLGEPDQLLGFLDETKEGAFTEVRPMQIETSKSGLEEAGLDFVCEEALVYTVSLTTEKPQLMRL